MLPFMKHALQNIDKPNVVVQLEYFWGDSSIEQYSGLSELLDGVVPSYQESLTHIRNDIVRDDDVTTSRPYANYLEQPAILREATIERGKIIFTPKTGLDETMRSRLIELSQFVATRPDQNFYVYVPPYQTSEVFKHTNVTAEQFAAHVNEMKAVFANHSNVRFKDFNDAPEQWTATDYIDWIHRTVSGEKKFAKLMQQWLQEG